MLIIVIIILIIIIHYYHHYYYLIFIRGLTIYYYYYLFIIIMGIGPHITRRVKIIRPNVLRKPGGPAAEWKGATGPMASITSVLCDITWAPLRQTVWVSHRGSRHDQTRDKTTHRLFNELRQTA